MKPLACLSTALVGLLAFGAGSAMANNRPQPKPLPACSALAGIVVEEAGSSLNKNPVSPPGFTLSAATPVTASIVPASGQHVSYCQVVFQLNTAITIEVGLPLSAADGGQGGGAAGCEATTVPNNSCVQGNWNGKIEAIGNGGYAGNVPGVTGATDAGFVGSSTDNGHSTNWCNAIDPRTGQPNAQPNCGAAGGGFELTPQNKLLTGQITDFIDRSEVEQTVWAKQLTDAYYGREASRTYWNGCSTGGRQGMQMAQFHPEMFDGILAGAPAFNWNRFIIGEMWPPVVVADVDPVDCPAGTAESCSKGIPASSAFGHAYTAANGAAVAACDALDGVVDGVINEPRRCHYSARALIGQQPSPMTSPMTEAEAKAIDLIWDGPRNQQGERLWGGITRGTSFSTLTASPFTGSLIATYVNNWMEEDPAFDILANITTNNFATFFQLSDRKFADTEPPPPQFVVPAATDSTDLKELMKQDTKVLHYRGSADPLIVPFGSWNYDRRVFDRYGVKNAQRFFRSFYYPGNGHCGGNGGFPNAGLINGTDLFAALVSWVENGVEPDFIVAYNNASHGAATVTRKICKYPDEAVYNGTGSTTDQANYHCVVHKQEPADLQAATETARRYFEAESVGRHHHDDHDRDDRDDRD